MFKVESAVIQFVVREYNDKGELVGEGNLPPQPVFRAVVPDVWAKADEVLAEIAKTPAEAQKSKKSAK